MIMAFKPGSHIGAYPQIKDPPQKKLPLPSNLPIPSAILGVDHILITHYSN